MCSAVSELADSPNVAYPPPRATTMAGAPDDDDVSHLFAVPLVVSLQFQLCHHGGAAPPSGAFRRFVQSRHCPLCMPPRRHQTHGQATRARPSPCRLHLLPSTTTRRPWPGQVPGVDDARRRRQRQSSGGGGGEAELHYPDHPSGGARRRRDPATISPARCMAIVAQRLAAAALPGAQIIAQAIVCGGRPAATATTWSRRCTPRPPPRPSRRSRRPYDQLGLGVGLEQLDDVDERRARDRVAADADDRSSCRSRAGPARCRSGRSACPSATRRRRCPPRRTTAGMIPTFALPGDRMPGQLGPTRRVPGGALAGGCRRAARRGRGCPR